MVPTDCTPGWRDLPSLAWVTARAYAPERVPRALAWIASVVSVLVWLPVLAAMRRSGQVAAVDWRAVVTVARLRNPIALLAAWALLVVISGWCVHTLDGTSGLWLIGGGLVIGSPVVRPWRVVRVQPAMWRVRKTLRDRDPGAPIYELGALAAWPRRRGHGSQLLAALLSSITARGFVVSYPRDDGLRQWYLRRGMLEHEPGGALYLDLRTLR